MNEPIDLGRCLSFINSQLRPDTNAVMPAEHKPRWRAVMISRQTGTGSHLVADYLAQLLQAHSPEGPGSWMVFDRNLLERVLEDHHLPARLAKFMPEDRISGIEDTLDELFGLHPPVWTLVEKTSDTILRLAEFGNVILLGRAGHIITSKMEHVFHVRLVGSLEARTEFVQMGRKIDRKTASELIAHEDAGSRRYVKRYFHKDIEDPQYYHLVINTPRLGHANAAKLIAETMLSPSEAAHALPVAHH